MSGQALIEAAKANDLAEIRRLVASGADTAAREDDEWGVTALHWAAIRGHTDAARLLLQAGADVSARSTKFDRTALHRAAFCGRRDVITLLLQEGADITARESQLGSLPLHLAAQEGHLPAVEALLLAGAHVDPRRDDNSTPLHMAALRGHTAVARRLLQSGAEVSARDSSGRTPLHDAAYKGHTAAAGALLEAGADPHSQTNNGDTALHDAATKEHQAVVRLLLNHPACLAITNRAGRTPADRLSPQAVRDWLDSVAKTSAFKRLQEIGHTMRFGSEMEAADKGREDILRRVVWSDPLLSRLRHQWGLSTEIISWLWRPQEQARQNKPYCDIIHPVDAVLAKCLSEKDQAKVGGDLKKLLADTKTTWLAAWKAMENIVSQRAIYFPDRFGSSPGDQANADQHLDLSAIGSNKRFRKYQIGSKFSGKALIINNINFLKFQEKDKNRYGSEHDEKALTRVLTKIGFDVEVERDLDDLMMLSKIKRFAKHSKHATSDAVVLAVLTHGDEQGLNGTNWKSLKTEEVIENFNNIEAPLLRGKPKWLILAACRGHRMTRGVWTTDDREEGDGARGQRGPGARDEWGPEVSDMYITYPTMPGNLAWRRDDVGTWAVQVLCDQLEKHWKSLSLHEIHLLVHEQLLAATEGPHVRQIMETAQRGWTRHLFFCKAQEEADAPQGAEAMPPGV